MDVRSLFHFPHPWGIADSRRFLISHFSYSRRPIFTARCYVTKLGKMTRTSNAFVNFPYVVAETLSLASHIKLFFFHLNLQILSPDLQEVQLRSRPYISNYTLSRVSQCNNIDMAARCRQDLVCVCVCACNSFTSARGFEVLNPNRRLDTPLMCCHSLFIS